MAYKWGNDRMERKGRLVFLLNLMEIIGDIDLTQAYLKGQITKRDLSFIIGYQQSELAEKEKNEKALQNIVGIVLRGFNNYKIYFKT